MRNEMIHVQYNHLSYIGWLAGSSILISLLDRVGERLEVWLWGVLNSSGRKRCSGRVWITRS